jgi:hypothetical protein
MFVGHFALRDPDPDCESVSGYVRYLGTLLNPDLQHWFKEFWACIVQKSPGICCSAMVLHSCNNLAFFRTLWSRSVS